MSAFGVTEDQLQKIRKKEISPASLFEDIKNLIPKVIVMSDSELCKIKLELKGLREKLVKAKDEHAINSHKIGGVKINNHTGRSRSKRAL